jgi:uncharacterized protein YxjI/photosystem II stability/assembly factor-like uncharacterized protein
MSKQSGLNDNAGFNNVSVSSISAKTLTLSEGFRGTFVVSGGDLEVKENAIFNKRVDANTVIISSKLTTELLVTNQRMYANADVDISGNLHVYQGDIYADHDITVLGNVDIRENLILGNNTAYLYTTPEGNTGINTRDAIATLDISGVSSKILNVYSSQPSNFNVLARNVDNRGISLYSNTTASSIGFYNDREIDSAIVPDATITYTRGGIITFDVSNSTNFISPVSISLTSRADHVMDETIVIYDISSAEPYLYDTYQNLTKRTGMAMTLVSQDSSSNTFLNIVSPNKTGLGIGGGGVDANQRTLGTLGLYDSSGTYTPAVNIVSGNSNIRYKTVVGVNTHAPLVDKYVLDVNGPIHISNGEITISKHANFEILKMSMSRTHPNYGVAIGTPTTLGRPYRQVVLYTNDGGNTWNASNFTGDTIENNLNYIRDVYVVDDRFSVFVGDNGNVRFSVDGGETWDTIFISIDSDKEFKSVYVSNTNRIFISSKQFVYWFDTVDIYNSTTGIEYTTHTNGTFSNVSGDITQITGHNELLFMICGGIIRRYSTINTTPTLDATYTNTSGYHYKHISAYNETYVSAITGNSITYTQNAGIEWTNLAVNYELNSISVYDASRAIVVGKNGVIAYTEDGNRTWDILPIESLNSSGNANTLVRSTDELTHIVFSGINNFIVTKKISVYTPTETGKTDIFHVFSPGLFNNTNNYVLDISGSIHLSGDINVRRDGRIRTTNTAFYLVNETAQRIFMGGDASMISLGNLTDSTVSVQHDLLVQADSSFNRNVSVDGNTRLRRNVYVSGDASLNANLMVAHDASLNRVLRVDGNTFLNNQLFVLGDASFGANLTVVRDASLNRVLRVDGNTFLHNQLFVLGDASFGANLTVVRDASLNRLLRVDGNTFLNNQLFVLGDASFGANLTVVRDTSLNRLLRVDGNTFLNNQLFVLGDASFGANLTVVADASLNRLLRVDGNTFLNNQLFLLGDASFGSNLTVVRDTSLNRLLRVDGNTFLNNQLFVLGDASFGANLTVVRDASLNRLLRVDGNTFLNNQLFLLGDASFGANLTVVRDTSLNRVLRVDGNTFLNNQLFVLGDASFGSNLTVVRDTSLNRVLRVDGNTFLHNQLFVLGDASFGANLTVVRDASLNRVLRVDGNTFLHNQLFVLGDASFGANLVVVRDTSLNRVLRVDGNTFLNNRLNVINDVSFGANLVVLRDTSLNRLLRVDGNTFLNNRLNVINDVSFGANLVVLRDASFNQNVSVLGNINLSGNLRVASENVVYSKYYEGFTDSADIYIGTRGLNQEPLQPRAIYIGNNGTTQNTKNIIKIGGGNDSIVLGGDGVTIEKINAGRYISFNDVDGGYGQYQKSGGAGLRFVDNSANAFAGLFVVSDDTNGFIFKSPGNTNVVKMDISAISFPANTTMKAGLMTLTKSSDTANSTYTIGAGTVDISNIFLKQYSTTEGTDRIQVIDTSMGILGNTYFSRNVAIGKTTNRPRNLVDISGNLYVDKINISTDGSLNSYKVEINGNVYQHGGFIWQF